MTQADVVEKDVAKRIEILKDRSIKAKIILLVQSYLTIFFCIVLETKLCPEV